MGDADAGSHEVLFRASKRRKVFRKRPDEDDDQDDQNPALQERQGSQPLLEASRCNGTIVRGNEVVKDSPTAERSASHRSGAARRSGVGFSNSRTQRTTDSAEPNERNAIIRSDPGQSAITAAASRFTMPTGQVAVKDDKHMVAYIDARMASIRSNQASESESEPRNDTTMPPHQLTPSHASPDSRLAQSIHRPGDVEEVEVIIQDGKDATGKPRVRKQRVRLGRDGKPLPPRKPRNAPTEDDIARDALVERLLSQNKFEGIYDESSNASQSSQSASQRGQNEDADARMAEEFQRDFLANVEENKARRQAAGPAAKGMDVMKGPKMGGSRNQRAAIAQQEKTKAQK